jgi:hypothetical protein
VILFKDAEVKAGEMIVPLGPGKNTCDTNKLLPQMVNGSFALAPFGVMDVIVGADTCKVTFAWTLGLSPIAAKT